MQTGSVVISCAGRDKAYLLAVIGARDGYVLVADGKERPIEKPKRKNKKHLVETGICLSEEIFVTNKHLRRALRECEIKEDF